MLLAAFDARRATADADALARGIPNEPAAVTAAVAKIAALDDRADGVQFLHQGASSRSAVCTFADELVSIGSSATIWSAGRRVWLRG